MDGRFQYRTSLFKEGVVFLNGGESGRTQLSKGDCDGGGYIVVCLFQKSCKSVVVRVGSSLLMDTTYMFRRISIIN